MILQVLANSLVTGCLYSFVGFGFALIYGTTRIFHFAHAGVYVAGAYLLYGFHNILGLPLVPSATLALIGSALLGLCIDEACYSPLNSRRSATFAQMLTSMGLYIMIVAVLSVFFQSDVKNISPEVQRSYHVGSVSLTTMQIVSVGSFCVVFSSILIGLRKTYMGRMIRALRDDPELVATIGINPAALRKGVFALGSMLAALSSILSGIDVGIDPHMGLAPFLAGTVATIMGGVKVPEGAIIGAFALAVLQNLAMWRVPAQWQDLITFVVLVVFMLLRPQGILDVKKRVEEEV